MAAVAVKGPRDVMLSRGELREGRLEREQRTNVRAVACFPPPKKKVPSSLAVGTGDRGGVRKFCRNGEIGEKPCFGR